MNNQPINPAVLLSMFFLALVFPAAAAETFVLRHGIIHTVAGGTFTNGSVLVDRGVIREVIGSGGTFKSSPPPGVVTIDLNGRHVYPGFIALNTSLGLTEIESVRATRDTTEVGDYTPDVLSWIAVNPDSELIPVARANGIACFEPAPRGNVVAGQSALLAAGGWTVEEMTVRAPAALHVFWPSMSLNTVPKERARDASKWKSLEDQAKERRGKLRELTEFFEEAAAYARAEAAGKTNDAIAPEHIPAWNAMLPYVRGRLPIVVHADDARQIRSAVEWARTNGLKIIVAGARDAARVAGLLATNRVPVIFEHVFVQPTRDTEAYDLHFGTPELLRSAGVVFSFGLGTGGFAATSLRNLPYAAAQAVAFGLPEDEALKALTLHPATMLGVEDKLGSLEAGKMATLLVCDGNIFDLRSHVVRMWINGREVALETRHTRLFDKYRNRPRPAENR